MLKTEWSPPCQEVRDKFLIHAHDVENYATLAEIDVHHKDNYFFTKENFVSCVPTFYFYKYDENFKEVRKIEEAELKGLAAERSKLKEVEANIQKHRKQKEENPG